MNLVRLDKSVINVMIRGDELYLMFLERTRVSFYKSFKKVLFL